MDRKKPPAGEAGDFFRSILGRQIYYGATATQTEPVLGLAPTIVLLAEQFGPVAPGALHTLALLVQSVRQEVTL